MSQQSSSRSEAENSLVEQLRAEVDRLQARLAELQNTDLHALRRAYTSLCQHTSALADETEGIEEELQALETFWGVPDLVANTVGGVGVTAIAIVLALQILRASPLHNVKVLARGVWMVGMGLAAWHFTSSVVSRLGSVLVRNEQRKHKLLQEWKVVAERIGIMMALTRSQQQQRLAGPPVSQPLTVHQPGDADHSDAMARLASLPAADGPPTDSMQPAYMPAAGPPGSSSSATTSASGGSAPPSPGRMGTLSGSNPPLVLAQVLLLAGPARLGTSVGGRSDGSVASSRTFSWSDQGSPAKQRQLSSTRELAITLLRMRSSQKPSRSPRTRH